MKIAIINREIQESHLFNAVKDAGSYIQVSTQTLRRWRSKGSIKEYKDFIICFNTTIHKSKGKIRNNRF